MSNPEHHSPPPEDRPPGGPWGPPPGPPPGGWAGPPPGYQGPPPQGPPPGWGQPPPGPGFAGGPPQFDPEAPFGRHPQTGIPYSDKQKLTAGLLQLFLGFVGAGRWYLGDNGIAVGQLLTCGGCHIWAIIDGIQILSGNVTDQFGRPLRD